MVKRNKKIIKYINITKDTVITVASKKTFWLFLITFITSCGIDLDNNTEGYISDVGQVFFQIISKIK